MIQVLLFVCVGCIGLVQSEWIRVSLPRMTNCPLLNMSMSDCKVRYPENSDSYITWGWEDTDIALNKLSHFAEKLLHCLLPTDVVCFFGDSLGRQLFTEMSCKYGRHFKYEVTKHDSGKGFILPESTILKNNATMHYRFVFPDSYQYMHAVPSVHWSYKCSHVLMSHGIWHVINSEHLMTTSEFKSNLTDALYYVRAMYPDAQITLLPVLTASNSFNLQQQQLLPCYFPSTAYQNARGPLNEEEAIIVSFNDVIQRISTDNSLSSLKAAYNMSSTLNCEKVEHDPVHWVQCQGVSTPLYREVVQMYLRNICRLKAKATH